MLNSGGGVFFELKRCHVLFSMFINPYFIAVNYSSRTVSALVQAISIPQLCTRSLASV